MANRKQRLLQDLYNVTPTLSQPQITPIFQGEFRMQGPMEESDQDSHANMMPFSVKKEYSSCSKNTKYICRPESGTCNVCSAPCSSCSHMNQHHMGSKVDECSGEASSENALSYSVNDGVPINKIVHNETVPKSWTRNFVSGSSSNTSENVDCEASCRNSDLSATSEIVAVLPKLDDFKVEGDHKDHQSCVTEIADSKLSHSSLSNGDNTDFSSLPVPADTPFAQESVLTACLQTSPDCLDARCNLSDSQNSSKRQRVKSKESLNEVPLSVCLSAALSSPKSDLLESPSDIVGDAIDRLNAAGNLSCHVINQSPSSEPSPEVLGENLSPGLLGEFLKCPNGDASSLSGETTSINFHRDPPEDDLETVEKNEGNADVCLSNVKENSLESHPMDEGEGEGDDSDLVEHDVKVCDICGDAGREDLLAICSRCSDGAEHTYCMREMLDKVPSGDWFCEECKFDVQRKSQSQETVDLVDGSEKINSSGQVSSESLSGYKKFEAKVSDGDDNKIYTDSPTAKILGKRFSDNVEVSCPAKRRALESDNGNANVSTSCAVPATARNSSFKLDRFKTKTNQHSSSSSLASPESANFPASASRLQTQGTFVKSNSFSSLNVKPKVNLVDDVPQKQRSVRESASLDRKEGVLRSMSKSMSFKSPNMGRLSIGDSKVKMLSPKFSHIQDTKGSNHSKDRHIFERKNSIQLERLPVANSGGPAAKNDKKLVSSGESNSLYSSRKFRDAKVGPSDGRSALLSKSSSFAARRGSEPSVSQGEVKRQSTTTLIGVSSTNADSNHVMKPNQDNNIKLDTSSYFFAEKPSYNASEGLPDGLSQQKESTKFSERAKDSTSSRSKQSSVIGGRTISCQKCKEIGHSALSCTADNVGSPSLDVAASKHSREGLDNKDMLKAAIEAAVLRKPGIYRKHRRSEQANDAALPNLNCEMASQVMLPDSSSRENVPFPSEMKGEQMVQETVDDVKHFPVISYEACSSRTEDSCPFAPLEGLSLGRDVPSRVSEGISTFFKGLAIPDNDHIWKGVFEVHRVGRTVNLIDGLQAHLSACASPKVLEAVNKFDHKVLLDEVPRLTMWPAQFRENGVKEDNIAVFFFAKDSASYEKSYKGLLNNMMKNDIALKGNFDGFELLIFPSNQLPEKSQRWNTLFFMWGVFRGKRVNKLVLASEEQNFVRQGIPTASMYPVNVSSDMQGDRGVSSGSTGSLASPVRASELTCLSSSKELKEGSDGRVPSDIKNNDPVQTEQPSDGKLNLRSFSVVQSSVATSCGETADTSGELKHSTISLEEKGHADSGDKRKAELEVYVEYVGGGCGSNESPQMPNCNSDLSRQHSSSAPGAHEMGCVGSSLDYMDSSKYETNLNEPGSGIQMVNDSYTRVASDDIRQVERGITAEHIAIEEEVRTREKQKSDCYGLHGANGSSTGSSLQICGVALPRANGGGGDDISAERYFFPVDPVAEEKVGRLMQSKGSGLEADDISPNLELALGAETKSLGQGTPTPRSVVGRDEQKLIWNLYSAEAEAARASKKVEEDDLAAASLSLSLSFPFRDTAKPLSRSEQLKPEAGHVNTSLLLFGVEGKVENRRNSSSSSSSSQGCDRFI